MKRIFFFLLILGFLLINFSGVSAFLCSRYDPECGSNPVSDCDVRQNTIFNPGTYNLSYGIDICANNIVLECNGATLINGIPHGIMLSGINGTTITNCNLINHTRGFKISSSFFNTLVNNNLNSAGVTLSNSKFNTINSNLINYDGIFLYGSSSNLIINNRIDSGQFGIESHFSNNNTIISNSINSNIIGVRTSSLSADNIFINNSVNANDEGFLFDSSNNMATGNNVAENRIGFSLGPFNPASVNIISNNSIQKNYLGIDIPLRDSASNLIYNNFFNNTVNAHDTGGGINFWNINKTPGTNIIGGPFLGGNFWSDYRGIDINGDGLGDTMLPYNSNGNILRGGDYLPLATPQRLIKASFTRNNCTQIPSNALSWWPAEGNGNDIIAWNNATLMNGAGFTQGRVNMSFSFDGVNDYAVTSRNVNIDNSRITIDAWIFPNRVQGALQKIFHAYNIGIGAVWLGITNSELKFSIYDTTGVLHEIRAPISANSWHHIAGTYDGSVQKLYMDGVLVRNTSWSGNFVFNSVLWMGRNNDDTFHYNGRIDEADIFNRALSQAEIQAIFNAGSNGKCRS